MECRPQTDTGVWNTWSTPLSALLACVVLLPLLGHRALVAWDEGIYAEVAREMLAGGHWQSWVVPHWNGQLWFEKPPLAMWLTACSLRLFGLNAFAARLPSALAGVATVTLLHRWLLRRFNGLTAWCGTVILLSAFGFQHAARAGETDGLLSLFSLLAVVGLAELASGERRGWLLFWVAFALALMSKGAASLTLPLTALVTACFARRTTLRFERQFATGLLLFLAFVLPWHLYLVSRFGQGFVSEYLGLHVLERATSAIEGHSTHPWFYLWVLLVSAAPFALGYPPALLRSLREGAVRSAEPRAGSTFPFAVYALVLLCAFSAARTRLPHYIAPVYAPLSGLTAIWLAAVVRGLPRRSLVPLATAAVLLYGGCAALTAPARRALHNPRLPSGQLTPDNRESAALLQTALRSREALPPGPLLLLRSNPDTPVTTDAFYSRRLVEQVTLPGAPVRESGDRYSPSPVPLPEALRGGPRFVLLDRELEPGLAAVGKLTPVATGPTQEVVVIVLRDRGDAH